MLFLLCNMILAFHTFAMRNETGNLLQVVAAVTSNLRPLIQDFMT